MNKKVKALGEAYSTVLERAKVREWIINNRGVLTQIAVACDCSPQFVQQVAYGKSTTAVAHKRVEDELRSAGWPGITRIGRRDLRIYQ